MKIFKCKKCGRCCNELPLSISLFYISDEIKNYLLVNKYFDILEKFNKNNTLISHNVCPFLKFENTKAICTIYPYRFNECITFTNRCIRNKYYTLNKGYVNKKEFKYLMNMNEKEFQNYKKNICYII